MARILSPMTSINPNWEDNICTFSDTGLPLITSTERYNRCPPSSTGMGKRLNTPRKTLSRARKPTKLFKPFCAEEPATLAMLIGPLKFFVEISPRISFNTRNQGTAERVVVISKGLFRQWLRRYANPPIRDSLFSKRFRRHP
jgi:hypothetical protein